MDMNLCALLPTEIVITKVTLETLTGGSNNEEMSYFRMPLYLF